jgi:DNA repair exonuclease SbcCD nuclease subunit
MPRFLHTADWQIGRRYSRFEDEDAAALFEARFHVIERIVKLATQEKVDAVLVSGDVFDMQTIAERAIHRTFQAMQAYAGPWLMIPGNHDAALTESVWTRAERIRAIPDNVHVLTRPEVHSFADEGFAALAAPLSQRQTHEDLTAWFDTAQTPEGLLRIGLSHGSATDVLPESVDSTNPIASDRAATARLDYLALGDWHGMKRINERTWYSGTPEQERFKDNDSGHVLVVDIAEPGARPDVTPHHVGRHTWVTLHRSISVATDIDELLQELTELPAQSVVDITLDGQIDLAGHERLGHAIGEASGRHRSLVVHESRLRLEPTDEDIAALHADGYVGEVVSDLRQQQDASGDETTARDALAILADLLTGHRKEAGS